MSQKRRKQTLPKSIKIDEFSKLIKHTKSKRYQVAFLLGFGSGLRVSEVSKLELEDIDFKDKKILVRLAKYSKDRIVPIPKGWRAWMNNYIPINKTDRSLQRAFSIARTKAKLNPEYTFHSLRHGFATRCIEQGVPINQVQLLLGHSNLSTTSTYLRANPKDALASFEELF